MQKTTLPNGLRLVTSQMPHTRSVAISFFIGAGSRYESEAQAGVSHFIEHLCFKGTAKRPTATDVCSPIEGVGGLFNGSTDRELTVYWCKVAELHFPLALDVICDMVLNSRFDPAEIEKERQVIIEEINMSRDSPSQEVALLTDEILWPDHPLGRDIAGTKQSVAGLTRKMMRDFLGRQYQPGNVVVSIAGAVEHEAALKMVGDCLGNWNGRQPPQDYTPYRDRLTRRVKVEKRETEQAQLCLALPGLSLRHPDRFSVDLLNVILGEGMSSRLFTEIRDKLGLAYSIYSYAEHFLDTGSMLVCAGVEPKKLQVAIRAILAELAKVKNTVTEAELDKAKELSKGRLLLSMEDSRNVAGWVGGQEILTGKILTVDEIIALVDAIKVADIHRVARELLVGERLRLAVVGPVAEKGLEGLLKL